MFGSQGNRLLAETNAFFDLSQIAMGFNEVIQVDSLPLDIVQVPAELERRQPGFNGANDVSRMKQEFAEPTVMGGS